MCPISTRLFAAVALLFAGILSAQDYRGSILGRVLDSTGAVVPGASITAVNEATNVASSTVSNAEGNFLVSLLDPGAYRITVEVSGFRKLVREGITVRTGDKLTLEFQLEVGATSESVTVTGTGPLVETNSANLAEVISNRYLELLYIANRNPFGLVALTPGFQGGGGTMGQDAQADTITANGGGGTSGNNEVVIDGSSVIVPRQSGDVTTSPSADAVEEVRIQSTMFDAAYGHSNGGLVSYATRGGTNKLRGSFEDFYRNEIFDANSWQNNRFGVPRGLDNMKLWSGVVGGPVYLPKIYDGRNRMFFFTSLERTSELKNAVRSAMVPTEAQRQGDFSQTLNSQGGPLTIYNPSTTVVDGTKVTRQPFPGNKVPSSMFDRAGSTLMNKYPLPNLNAVSQLGVYNWVQPGANDVVQMQITQRIDRVISDKQRLYGRYGNIKYDTNFPVRIPEGIYSCPVGGGQAGDNRRFHNALLADNYIFNPTTILEVRLGFSRIWTTQNYSGNSADPKSLGLSEGIISNQIMPGWPMIIMGSGMPQYGSRYKIRSNDSYNLNVTLSKMAGSHNVRFGGETRMVNWNENSPDTHATGYFSFDTLFSQSDPFTANTSRTTGASMVSLLLGIPTSGDISGPATSALRSMYYAGFIQDDWKITPRLTLNFGVRYEMETPYTERNNYLLYGFDRVSASPAKVPGMNLRGYPMFACVAGKPCRQGDPDINSFGPRFGFAYQLRPGTVLRGGYGLFYASLLGNMGTSTDIPSTFNRNYTYIATRNNGATPYTTLQNPFPAGLIPPLGSSLGNASMLGESVRFVEQSRVLPYTQQMQFGIQQSLPLQTRVEVAFVRQVNLKGVAMPGDNMQSVRAFNLNELPSAYLALGVQQNLQVPNPFYGILPAATNLGSSQTIAQKQLWLAYPQFTGVSVDGANTVNAQYQRVQLNLEKRFTHGLSVLFNWNISKLMQNNMVSLINTEANIRGISATDTPHVLNLAFAYDLPFGPGRPLFAKSGAFGRIVGGWALAGTFTYASGQPMSVSDTNGRPIPIRIPAFNGPVVGRLGDKVDPVTRQVTNPYFDTNAWSSLPTQYMISPEPLFLSYLRSPASKGSNASLVKQIQVKERLHVTVRLDAAGVFNTPNWGNPGTNLANKATFGVINSASGQRKAQVALRVAF